MLPTEQNKEIAMRFAKDGWGTNPNWQAIWDKTMIEEVIYHFNSSPEPIVGLQANKDFNAGLFEGFPDIRQEVEDLIAESDKVVYRTTLHGTHTGHFLGVPPTNNTVNKISGFTELKISDGKIIEWWYDCNLLKVMEQLGLIES
ncbi:MAG: ester cyclase [Cyanobacteria bacterium P01_H01_bin.105]